MRREFHPEAAANFNRIAEELIKDLAPLDQPDRQPGFRPDMVIAADLQLSRDNLISFGASDHLGNEVERSFPHEGKLIGLRGPNLQKLLQLAQTMQRRREINRHASAEFLSDAIFDWMSEKYRNAPTEPMTAFVLSQLAEQETEQDIWIPISHLHVQAAFKIGNAEIRPIPRELFDKTIERAKAKPGPSTEAACLQIEKERKSLQSLGAVRILVQAEPKRATELAFEEAERALGALRFFHGANLDPRLTCYCVPLGKSGVPTRLHLTVVEERIQTTSKQIAEKAQQEWIVDAKQIQFFNESGLARLGELLSSATPGEFEADLLSSLLLYTQSCLYRDPADRLIYTLVSLESMLLRDVNEPIEHSLSERMAFLGANGYEARMTAAKTVKKAYALRSSFIHHGIRVEDEAALREFMFLAWQVWHRLLHSSKRIPTRDALFKELDKMKFS